MIDLEAIREAHPLPAVAGAVVKLRRAGNDLRACCPFHNDRTPSFYLFDEGRRFHCFGCNASGDVLDFVQRLHRVSLPTAAEMLGGGSLPRAKVAQSVGKRDPESERRAGAVWQSCGPIEGTPAARYLERRGVAIASPGCLRFGRVRLGERAPMPALVALIRDGDGQPAGVQRIFLREDGRKADLPGGKVKFSLGRCWGGAVRLTGDAVDGLLISGSVEDGLSLVQMGGAAVWAAPGEGMLCRVVLPDVARSVVIAGDGDDEGREHASRAADAFAEQGRSVRVIFPQAPAKDFNDELQGALNDSPSA